MRTGPRKTLDRHPNCILAAQEVTKPHV